MRTAELVVSGLSLGSIYAFVALGFHLVYRMTRVLDFAQGDKVVLGSLIGLSLIRSGAPVVVALLAVGAIGIVAGAVYDRVVIQPSARNGTIPAVAATVGASLVIANTEGLIYGTNGEAFPALVSGGFRVFGVAITYQAIVIWVALAVVAVGLGLLLTRSRFGKGLVAAATDPLAATAVGVSTGRARAFAFTVAFALAAVAGVLVAPFTLAGGGGLGTTLTLYGFAGAVLGGLMSTPGVIVGSLIIGVAENLAGGWLPNGYQDPIIYGLLLAVLLVAPTGLFGVRRERVA
jgi:branched-chain amino acid transport system permease protein